MGDIQVETASGALWVNDAVGCIGRFTARDAVVLPRGERQLSGEPFVLDLQGLSKDDAWPLFVRAMEAHHGVVIAEDLRPAMVVPGPSRR